MPHAAPENAPHLSNDYLPPGAERAVGIDGALAAALERVARTVATSLEAPAAAVLLLGQDRRCFAAGSNVPAWLIHDPGALFRSGLAGRVLASDVPIVIQDVRAERALDLARAANALGIGGFVATRCGDPTAATEAIVLAFDSVARSWDDATMRHLDDLAAAALTELELQRRTVEAARVESQRRHDALHDLLTGLPNRALFLERLRHAGEQARRGGDFSFAVLFLDLDNFKAVNDSLGHSAGDELLGEVARRLSAGLRAVDTLARLGGDEFALLLEEVREPSDAARVAERLLLALRAPVRVGDGEVFTSASIGIALDRKGKEVGECLLRSADIAMYRAKEHGRARFEVFDPPMHAVAVERLRIETDLRRALERNQLVLHYQPVVSLVTGSLVAVEALLRWNHPERGLVAPADFIPIAERTGLILEMGQWVLDSACKQLQSWEHDFGYEAPQSVWVNVSAKQFTKRLARDVGDVFGQLSLDSRRIKLEITESIMLEDVGTTVRTLTELRELGIQVFMDDFGTGYSSLSNLGQLPLDGIKVDRTFVGQMGTDPRHAQLVRTIVTLIRNLGLEPIAEGVETAVQAQLLRDMGCAFAQGFVFSRPVPPRKIDEMIRARTAW